MSKIKIKCKCGKDFEIFPYRLKRSKQLITNGITLCKKCHYEIHWGDLNLY